MKISFGFNVIWSNNRFLLPASKVKHDGRYIISTNRFERHTYRLKPYLNIKFNVMLLTYKVIAWTGIICYTLCMGCFMFNAMEGRQGLAIWSLACSLLNAGNATNAVLSDK